MELYELELNDRDDFLSYFHSIDLWWYCKGKHLLPRRDKFRPQAVGNIVAKHVDYLIHSTLQPMPYYSKTYDTEHKYREYLVAVVYKCKLSKIVYFKLCN